MGMALVALSAGAALAASINCPTASGGYCYGTGAGDALYGTAGVDRIYGYGGTDLIYGYGGADHIHGGAEGDRMLGGTGADQINGQGGADAIYGGAGNDQLNGGAGNDVIQGDSGSDTIYTGTGSDRVNARDGERDFITCEGADDLVYYDVGLDVLEGCAESGRVELPPPDGLFEVSGKVLVDHGEGKKELCVAEAALKGHLEHGDGIINATGCSA